MFDSVRVPCPGCGTENEWQSKSGECLLRTYTYLDAPDDVLLGIRPHAPCESCGKWYKVRAEITYTVELTNGPWWEDDWGLGPDEKLKEETMAVVSSARSVTRETAQDWLWMRNQRFAPPDILRHVEVFSPPIDIRDVAGRLRIDVVEDRHTKAMGRVEIGASWGARIIVPAEAPRPVQRFIIAHEIGHLMLHSLEDKAFTDHTFAGSAEEIAANRFAADLLMPMPMVEQFAEICRYDLGALAARFDVSPEAMQVRLEKLAGH